MARAAPRALQGDLDRAFAAVTKANVRDYRVTIEPDGTISVIVGTAARTPAKANSCDDLLRR